jgi:hypothetical protein
MKDVKHPVSSNKGMCRAKGVTELRRATLGHASGALTRLGWNMDWTLLSLHEPL